MTILPLCTSFTGEAAKNLKILNVQTVGVMNNRTESPPTRAARQRSVLLLLLAAGPILLLSCCLCSPPSRTAAACATGPVLLLLPLPDASCSCCSPQVAPARRCHVDANMCYFNWKSPQCFPRLELLLRSSSLAHDVDRSLARCRRGRAPPSSGERVWQSKRFLLHYIC